jgi:hypothetical protein
LLVGVTSTASAAVSRQQIEADWAVQNELRAPESPVTAEQDAAGACDGIKDGQWGFHTQYEDRPWWQIDLGNSCELDCLHLYNRTEFAQRAARLIVLVSEDGKDFRRVYQHDGTVFLGHADGRPLKVPLTSGPFRLSFPAVTTSISTRSVSSQDGTNIAREICAKFDR